MSRSLRNTNVSPMASDYGPLDGDFDPFEDDEAVDDLVTFE